MNQIIKILCMVLFCQLTYGSNVELLTTLERDGLFKVEGKYIGDDSKPVRLTGKARVRSMQDSKDKIYRILWTEVAGVAKGKPKYFPKPVLMTVPTLKITKGTKLSDHDGAINEALANLKTAKPKVKLKDKYSDVRKVLEPIVEGNNTEPANSSGNTMNATTQAIGKEVRGIDNPSYNTMDNRAGLHGGSGNGRDRRLGYGGDRGREYPRYREREGFPDNNRGYSSDTETDNSYTTLGSGGDSEPQLNLSSTPLPELPTVVHREPTPIEIEPTPSNSEITPTEIEPRPNNRRTTSTERDLTPEPNTRIEIVKDGCPIRLDYDNDRAIVQNKAITYTDDVKTNETECTDSLEYFLIKKDYLCENCSDYVDLEAMTACPTYEKYYTNAEGSRIALSTEPEKDETQEFPIISDSAECPPHINLEDMTASKQVELIYQDRVNARKVAKICHVPDSAEETPITLTRVGCTPTHDFDNNWSIDQQKSVFSLDGQEHVALGCREVGRPIRHEFDTAVCTSNINVDDRVVSVMGRRFVMIDDEKIYLSDCEPIQSEQVLMESTEGCEHEYEHKYDERRSYLKKRWYWLDGTYKQFVTPCAKSTEFKEHHEEVTGYQHDDANKRSTRIVTIYINPDDREDIRENYINPHSPDIPHELVSTIHEPTDSFAYSGCFKITQTSIYRTYRRPDGTTYRLFMGVGTPARSGNLCTTSTEERQVYHHTHVIAKTSRSRRGVAEFDVVDPNEAKYVPAQNDGRSYESWTSNEFVSRGNAHTRRFERVGYLALHICSRHFSVQNRTITNYPDGTSTASEWVDTGRMVDDGRGRYKAIHTEDGGGIATPRISLRNIQPHEWSAIDGRYL